jgi:hypothetical protein
MGAPGLVCFLNAIIDGAMGQSLPEQSALTGARGFRRLQPEI